MAANTTRASRYVIAAAQPRRETPWRWNHSTAGLSASARKREMSTQVTTWRAIQITSSTTATAMIVARMDRIVRSRKRTRRSAITHAASPPYRTSRGFGSRAREQGPAVSLRGRPVEQSASLPDGSEVRVRVGVPEDPYIPRKQLDTVDVELFVGDRPVAAVNTVLTVKQESEALQLAREIVAGLESGKLEPTAAAIEPLADDPY